MLDFTFYTPTKVFFGKDKHKEIGKIIKEYGFTKIMMQYGKSSIKKSGLYDAVVSAIRAEGIEIVDMGGVEPNPKLAFAKEAARIAKEEGVQMILAVGGGSVLDSSKYTAAGACYDGDLWDFPTKKHTPGKALPVGCILTHAAAGSEMSSSAVISYPEIGMKRGFNSDTNRCLFAVMNPELTYTVGAYQTACGVVDMMSHTMERYFSLCPPTELTDNVAEGILKAIIKAGKTAVENPTDYEARATLMWASSLAHNDLTGCGRENVLPVHQLEHALSGEYDGIAHGAGLAVLYPAWARFMYKKDTARFARFARNVWDVAEADDEEAAWQGIKAMEAFFASIGMPTSLLDFDIAIDCIDRLVDLCTFSKTRTIKSYVDMDEAVLTEIFRLAFYKE